MRTIYHMVEGWVKVLPLYLFTLLPLFTSCSEDDGVEEEYPDWQARNDAYFLEKFNEYAASSSSTRFFLKTLTLPDTPSSTYASSPADFILVDVLEEGSGMVSPQYSDTVNVHYVGRLLPSRSYPEGYKFDYSYEGNFDAAVASPSKIAVGGSSGAVPGFATALQNMHRGDHWRITIPYQLGYGIYGSGTAIPGYSTLIFDVRLADFWFKEKGDRDE